MDLISRYYYISEIFNDDIKRVAMMVRLAGATARPCFIIDDLSNLALERHATEINYLYKALQDESSTNIIKVLTNAFYRAGGKYSFDAGAEVKKGEILNFVYSEHKIKKIKKKGINKYPSLF